MPDEVHVRDSVRVGDLAQEVAQKMISEEERLRLYLISPECRRILNILQQQPYVDHGRLRYKLDTLEGVTADDFGSVCDAVFFHYEGSWIREENKNFSTFYVDYENVRFHLALGQGCAYWTTQEEILASEGQKVY